MADRLHYTDLERLLADDGAPDEAIAPYLKATASVAGPLVPHVEVEETLVELPSSRGLIGLTTSALNNRAHRRRAASYRQKIDGGWTGLKLLAEGDSWFQYPILLQDVIDNLSLDYAVYSEAAAGDTLASVARGLPQLEQLIRLHGLDGLLLSAGGNDIAGKALHDNLLPHGPERHSAASYLGNRFAAFLAETRQHYDACLGRLTTAFPHLQIFCHGYDWPLPRANGAWLAPALLERQIPANVQPLVLRLMIDRYYDMLKSVAYRYQGRVHVVDCRSAVGEIGEWFDELHPRNAGFARAADRFRAAINKAYNISPSTRSSRAARVVWYARTEGPAAQRMERTFAYGSEITIGRSEDRTIRLADKAVSRNHARLEVCRADVELEDVGSSNGTRLVGERIKRARWRPGQKLSIGGYDLELDFVEAPPPPTAAVSMSMSEAPASAAEAHAEPLAQGLEKQPSMPAVMPAVREADAPGTVIAATGPAQDVGTAAPAAIGVRPFEIVICSGSITSVASPAYAIGVFQNVNPLGKRGTAYEINDAVGGLLSSMVQGGVINSQLGEISLLPATRQRSLAQLILVAGLGAISKFVPQALETVGENLARMIVMTRIGELATVPIGAGAGVSIRDFAGSFLRGFLRGLNEADPSGSVRKLSIVEIGHERHAALLKETNDLQTVGFFKELGFQASVSQQAVGGGETRSSPSPILLSPVYLEVQGKDQGAIDYSILAAELGATIQTHRKTLTPAELERVATMTGHSSHFDATIGKTLADAFLPDPMQELITRALAKPNGHLVVIHDRASSTVPWEAVYLNGRCPALDKGLSRLYRIGGRTRSAGRQVLPRSSRLRLLMIENPTRDLTGAQKEGDRLTKLFKDNRGDVTVLSGQAASRAGVLKELAAGTYDILHYAGHADFSVSNPGEGGLVLSDGRLTAADMQSIGKMPQLIFLNACESGRLRGSGAAPDASVGMLSPSIGIAESFLVHGAANFVGTFWKVDDIAADSFAATFYAGLLAGKPLSVAMREARIGIQKIGPRDWANYLHFGDPLYVLRQQ